jgi:hypothetical protein
VRLVEIVPDVVDTAQFALPPLQLVAAFRERMGFGDQRWVL